MQDTLLSLFRQCLSLSYRHTDRGGDFAYYRKQTREETALYIFFQQSNGAVDWLHNLQFRAVDYGGPDPSWQAHGGFVAVWESILTHLELHIADPSVRRIVIVGYSHGAALAVLCHEYVWQRRPDLRSHMFGVGFGCPRVLYGCPSPPYALRWEAFWVVRCGRDAVTHLPPRAAGFCHVGNLLTLEPTSSLSPIDAHRPEAYLAALERLM